MARLAARLARRPLRGRVVTAKGGARRARLSQAGLYGALVGGDLDSILRGQLPAAAASAVRGDPAPLLRLTGAAGSESEDEGVSVPVFLATTCSESALPWDTAHAADAGARASGHGGPPSAWGGRRSRRSPRSRWSARPA